MGFQESMHKKAEEALAALTAILQAEGTMQDLNTLPKGFIQDCQIASDSLRHYLNTEPQIEGGIDHARRLKILNNVPLVEGTLEYELYQQICQGIPVTSRNEGARRNALSNLRRNGYIFNKGSRTRPEWIVVE
jgi:hypothetical protein